MSPKRGGSHRDSAGGRSDGGIRPGAFPVILFLLGFSALSFQVVVTRLFSFLLYHDFVFLALSLAILGMGVGAMIAAYLDRSDGKPVSLVGLVLYGTSLWASIATLAFLPSHETSYVAWIVSGLACLPPFILMGALAAQMYRRRPERSGLLYASDLCGASLGVLAAIPGMLLGPFRYTFLLSAGVLALCTVVGLRRTRARRLGGGVLIALTVVPLILAASSRAEKTLEQNLLTRLFTGKPLFEQLKAEPKARIDVSRWTAVSRVDLVSGADSRYKALYTDGSVPAYMRRFRGDWDAIRDLEEFLPFAAFTYGGAKNVLSIGAGGGLDVLMAKLGGAARITAVEINRDIVRLVEQNADYNGGVFGLPGVRVFVDEGRTFVRGSKDRYDLILLLLAQGNRAEIGGRVMLQDFLTTREALHDYYDHLTPNGKIALVVHEPFRAARYFVTWVAMMEERGIGLPEAMSHFAFLAHPDPSYNHLLLFHKNALDADDLAKLRSFVDTTPAVEIFIPRVGEVDPSFHALAAGDADIADFKRSMPKGLNLQVASDDRPFRNVLFAGVFLDMRILLGLSLAMLAILIATPYISANVRRESRRFASWTLYFSGLGVGFMIVEVIMIRRFMFYLGYPTLALAVVLFALLVSAGSGASFSQRFVRSGRGKQFGWLPVALFVFLPIFLPVATRIMDLLLAQPILIRSAGAFVLICVPGFLMGMPFPVGMARAGEQLAVGNTWMWGINGVASVVGSALAMVLAMTWGMSVAFWAGATCYVLAGCSYRSRSSP